VDGFGRVLTAALNQAIAANSSDSTAPTISSTAWAANFAGPGYQVTVVFNEAMDETTAETLANYRINGTAVNPTTASLGNDGKTATLTFTTLALDTANTLDVSLAATITDINARAKTQVLAQAIAANSETTKPSVVSATETGVNQVTVVFNEAMDETSANLVANYTWSAVITTTAATLQTNGTTVILTTSGDPSTRTLTVGSVQDINANTNNAFVSGVFP
jgi:hypothetical protein